MPRLIEADKLKEHYAWWEGGSLEMTLDEVKRTFDTIIDVQPTVDAVEVIRCKDCKYYYVYDRNNNKNNFCDLDIEMMRDLDPNHYCAFAERREDEAN